MTFKPCLACGEPTDGPRCPEHSLRLSTSAKGYDEPWRRLSTRARRLQQFCSDCGTTDDLTCDHTPEAWDAKAAGRPITLQLVDVVCRECNARRGQARTDRTPGGKGLRRGGPDPAPGNVSLRNRPRSAS